MALSQFLEVLEIVERSARRVDDVATTVVPPVLLDAETACRARDHLPQARRTTVRIGERVVGALDDGQQCELHRQSAAFEFGADMRHVALRTREDTIEIVGVPDVPVTLGLNAAILLIAQLEVAP